MYTVAIESHALRLLHVFQLYHACMYMLFKKGFEKGEGEPRRLAM